MKRLRLICVFTGMSMLAGCSTLPHIGPSSQAIMDKGRDDAGANGSYALIDVSSHNIGWLAHGRNLSFSKPLRDAHYERGPGFIGSGDMLNVVIIEADPEGIFSTLITRGTSGLNVQVDQQGVIFIPFAGRIPVAGLTVSQARDAVASRLKGKAVYPQVILSRTSGQSQMISVIGDVARTSEVEIPLGGLRLVQALAIAGGLKDKAYEARISLVRDGVKETLSWSDLVDRMDNNVWLRPGDIVEVSNKPRTFSILGAVRTPNLLNFPHQTATLADALSQAGGLLNGVAGAGGIFVFRMEDPGNLPELEGKPPVTLVDGKIPTVYRFNLLQPATMFMISKFEIRDKDLIYVATSPSAEISSFISTFIAPITSLGVTGRSLAQ